MESFGQAITDPYYEIRCDAEERENEEELSCQKEPRRGAGHPDPGCEVRGPALITMTLPQFWSLYLERAHRPELGARPAKSQVQTLPGW